jgi:autotransporter-associated beta strand protein
VNGGVFMMNSNADNTLVVNPTATGLGLQALTINAGNVDINGRNLAVGALSSTNLLPSTGGGVTNSSATAATFTSVLGANATFGGVLSGNLGFTRAGNFTTTLTSAQTYTGATTIRGGILQLRDAGALTASSGVANYFGTLNLDSSNYTNFNSTNRLVDTIPLSMYGATLTLTGAPGLTTAETVGTVTLEPGASTITSTPGSVGTAPLTISNLIRNAGASVNFTGTTLGTAGLEKSQVILTQLNGATPTSGSE